MPSTVAMLPNAANRNSIVESFGETDEYSPYSPIRMHTNLVGHSWKSLEDDVSYRSFTVNGREFWWLSGAEQSTVFSERVNLEGHAIVEPSEDIQEATIAAVEHIATVPWAFEVLSEYSPAFAVVEALERNPKPITSCSLPDFPTLSFYSRIALRHIPPVSVARRGHPILLAENLFHESVHQYVNHQILTAGILIDSYDSSTSPGIPISWRFNKDGTNQIWQVDRALHAATVYSNILAWRREVLHQFGDVDEEFVGIVQQSTSQAIRSVIELYKALEDNLDQFTPKGAHRVGQLAAQTRDLIASVAGEFRPYAEASKLK